MDNLHLYKYIVITNIKRYCFTIQNTVSVNNDSANKKIELYSLRL